MALKETLIHALLKCFVILTYVVSHLWDYVSYPVYFLYYRAWRVRRYKRSNHARREDRDDCIIFHSTQDPGVKNEELQKNGLDTMQKVFEHVTAQYVNNDCLGTRDILGEEDEIQPNGKVFKKYILGNYQWKTFGEFHEESSLVGQGLRKLGLKSKDRIAILAETRADWLISAYACFQNNITIVTLYTNLGNEGVSHALNETEVEVLICSHETLPKVKQVISSCSSLKKVIVMDSLSPAQSSKEAIAKINTERVGTTTTTDFLLFSTLKQSSFSDGEVSSRCPPTPSDIAIIMYTSGSTGNPKGVMLSHRNLVTSMSALINISKFRQRDRYIGYLPLAHVLELLAESSVLLYGIKIGYSSAATLTNKSAKVKAGCKGDANLFRPTLMCSVPLILERIYKSIVDTMRRQGWAAEELFHYFMAYKMKWQDRGFDTPLLNKTLFRKIRYFLGGRVRLMLSGGAPLSPDTHSLTRTCICVPLMQGYGLTETTACATVTSIHDRTTGRAGAPLMNIRVKLVNWEEGNYLITDKPRPRGEIHIGGDNIATGYFKNEKKTDEDFYDEDGRRWFRTGDIGEVFEDGVLKIVDRKKDLVKLQHGEYVSYGKVEAVLKTCPIIDNVCLYADPSKNYLIAIVVPDRSQLKDLAAKSNDAQSLEDLIKDSEIEKKIVALAVSYGQRNGLERFELPTKLILTLEEWTPDSGLVTAAFKIRRRQIVDHYKQDIDRIYV